MELEVKFIDSSSVIFKKDECLKATIEKGFFVIRDGALTILCAPKESVLYYKVNRRAD